MSFEYHGLLKQSTFTFIARQGPDQMAAYLGRLLLRQNMEGVYIMNECFPLTKDLRVEARALSNRFEGLGFGVKSGSQAESLKLSAFLP